MQCSPVFSPGHFSVMISYPFTIGWILWRVFVFVFGFFSSSFFFLPFHSLIQLESWLGFHQIPIFFSITLFSFIPLLHFFFPPLFCPSLISSSPFPLPSFLISIFSPLFFLFFFPFLLPLSATFLSLFPPFYSPDFFLLFPSSLFLIVFFSFSPLNFFLVSPLYQGGCYEHKG